jgi:putative transposase
MTMSDVMMALLDQVDREADADLVREMLALATDRMMAIEIKATTEVPAGRPFCRPAQSPRRLPRK